MAKKVFIEEQEYNNRMVLLTSALFMTGFVLVLFREIIWQQSFNITALVLSVVGIVSTVLAFRFFSKFKMRTTISKKSITVRASPFYCKKHKIKLKDIKSCELVKSPAIAQWHGGNISFANERFFSFSGRNGLQITTKDGESYFIGSRKVEELGEILCNVFEQREMKE